MISEKIRKAVSGAVVAAMLASSALTASAESISFPDVKSDGWAYPYISQLVEKNIVTGYEDGTFRPDTKLTQATFLTLVMRTAYGTQLTETGKWWQAYYDEALDKDLIDEDEYQVSSVDTTTIDRFGMAKLINRVLRDQGVDINAYETGEMYIARDYNQLDGEYKVPVRNCYLTGILTGYDDSYFHGERAMQRDSASAVICRMMDVLEKSAGTSPNTASGSDEELPEFVVDRDGYVVHIEGYVYAISDQEKYEKSSVSEISPSEAGVPAAGAMMEFYDMDPVKYPEAEVTARIYTDENGHYSIDYPGRPAGMYPDSSELGTRGGRDYWFQSGLRGIPVVIQYQDENGDYYSTVRSYFNASRTPTVIEGIGIEWHDIPNLTQDLTCMKDGISVGYGIGVYQHDLEF